MDDMTAKFAKAIHERRKELGLTQEELAERVGTTKQVVSKYENGQRSPKVVMANAFADALETTLDELLGVEKENNDDLTDAVVIKDPQIRAVSGAMENLSAEQKDQIVAIVLAAVTHMK